MKNIILCADDFSLNGSISSGIIDLIKYKRLSAVSCLVNSSNWTSHAGWLMPFAHHVDIGLHFNLTEGKSISAHTYWHKGTLPPLKKLLIDGYIRRIPRDAVHHELQAQIDAFRQMMKRDPDFIDGHQHIHQFPLVRDVLLKVYEENFPSKYPYIRVSTNSLLKAVQSPIARGKHCVIFMTGGYRLKKMLDKRNIFYNKSFYGAYSFSMRGNYKNYFSYFLSQVDEGGIIMCHPATAGIYDQQDPIAEARIEEYMFLKSADFHTLCETFEINLARFHTINK
jgi:chitin disaccharide deacetylase